MAEAAPVVPVVDPAPAPEVAAPVPNLVAEAQATPAPAPEPALALAVAAVDPAVARAYLAEHGMTADDAAKIPDADLAKKYEDTKAAESAKPIEYKDFVLPENVKFDEAKLSDIKKEFAADKLSQDRAQKYIDMHTAAVKESVDANVAAFSKMQTDWRAQVMADPEIGGANFDAKTSPAIAKFIDVAFADAADRKAYRDIVTLTGIGNHPLHVKALARIGASLMEGSPALGSPNTNRGPKSFEQMAADAYPNSPTIK